MMQFSDLQLDKFYMGHLHAGFELWFPLAYSTNWIRPAPVIVELCRGWVGVALLCGVHRASRYLNCELAFHSPRKVGQ